MKIPPITAANKLNLSNLMRPSVGIAISAYRKIIEPREKKKVFPRDLPASSGMALPINMKLMMLKNAPRINPFPTAFDRQNKYQSR